MENLKSPNFFLIVGIAVIVIVLAVFVSFAMLTNYNDSLPPKITSLSARFSGETGEMIVVHYNTDKPITEQINANDAYIQDEATGKKFGPMTVPRIGSLLSQNVGKTIGYFVADNGDFDIVNGTKVTIVLGKEKFEHYTMIYTGKPEAF